MIAVPGIPMQAIPCVRTLVCAHIGCDDLSDLSYRSPLASANLPSGLFPSLSLTVLYQGNVAFLS